MAAAMPEGSFSTWISEKLQNLNVDDEVFGSYIIGILEEEETSHEEKSEAIAGILVEVENESVEDICSDILEQWDHFQPNNSAATTTESDTSSKSEATMSSIMEKHATTLVKKQFTKEQRADKAAVLAMYAQVSEDEEYP
ncbi:putative coiled-coil domain-containing protein [Apostichopus japonicus]|uniref:Coiled-coil domain-containing protein 43 n=1 Tax=Stichopus japonicus TaxID=307972 RepID=A0A2G8KPV0_STIJA|nr:putative coiled-coil domain-containing protein [Apostichopus japonicus]